MKFAIVEKALHVSAETSREVLEMIKHYSLDTLAHVENIASGTLTKVCKPGRENGEWFAVSCELGPEWVAPYLKRLEKLTGYAGPVPVIPAPRYPGGYCENLCHTHIVETATVSSDGYTARGFVHSQDWNGKTAAQRYRAHFADYVSESIGGRKSEPQYIRMNNGWLKENPNYLKRYGAHAELSSALLFGCLLQWWTDTQATPGQREILRKCDENHRTVCPRDSLASYLFRSYEPGFRVSWESPLVSFDEFKGA